MATMPAAQAAINTLLQRGNGGSPETFTTVANVSSINGFDMSVKSDDVTSHSSGVPWRQKIPTLIDPGKLTTDIFYIPSSAGHKQLVDDFANRRILDYKLVFPDAAGTTWQCQMFIQQFKVMSPVDGVTKAQLVFELTGDPVLPTV